MWCLRGWDSSFDGALPGDHLVEIPICLDDSKCIAFFKKMGKKKIDDQTRLHNAVLLLIDIPGRCPR